MNNQERNKEKNTRTTVTKGSLILRIVVSVYLLYTVYSLFGSVGTAEGKDKIIVIVAMIAFTAVALPLGGFSIHAMSQGNYVQPDNHDEAKTDEAKTDEESTPVVDAENDAIEQITEEESDKDG